MKTRVLKGLLSVCFCLLIASCGGGGGSGSTTDTSSSSDPLLGNYMFMSTSNKIASLTAAPDSCLNGVGVRCYTITEKTSNITSEGSPIYTGNYATADGSVTTSAALAWYPSLNSYVLAEADTYGIGFYQWYKFTIGDGGALTGWYCTHVSGADSCWELGAGSVKTAEGEWVQ